MTERSKSRVGYEVTITRRDFYDGMGTGHDWHVHAKRLSDGAEIVRTFDWRWNARRFARSPRRLGTEFAHMSQCRSEAFEQFTLGWRD